MSPDPSSQGGEPGATGRVTRVEWLAYGLLGVALFIVMWRRTSAVDAFYLDEWFYVHGGEYIWSNLPQALWGTIPEWNRGTQRLYSVLIGLPWTVFGTSTAYTVTHLLNVVLLISAIVPAALIARRVLDQPVLRVLAVALAVALPTLMISLHLLTENLAFPLFLWVCLAAIRAAEAPGWRRWLVAVVLVGLLTLVRTNFAAVFAILLVAAVAGEVVRRRDGEAAPLRASLLGALRRNWLLLAATALGIVVALRVLSGSTTGSFGVYGNFGIGDTFDRLFGDGARATRQTALTYARNLIQGGFVLPFALGAAVGLAGLLGRLGARLVIPSAVALSGFLVLVLTTSAWTAGAALEDRYVFAAYAPIALLAPVAVVVARRLRLWLVLSAVGVLWAFVVGSAAPAANAGHFFASPGGAFWTRVLDLRLRTAEGRFLGWTLLPQTGWLLVAVGLVALVAIVFLTARRPRVRAAVLGGGLTLCVLAQVASLNYGYGQELFGTTDAAGGIALNPGRAQDRQDWVDDRVPGDARAAIVPGPAGQVTPMGGTEVMQFWSRDIDQTIDIQWNGTGALAPPGTEVLPAPPGPDGVAAIEGGTPHPYAVAWAEDPRIQFPGRELARSPNTRYALFRLDGARAMWTATAVDGDGAVLADRPATLTLDRQVAPDTRAVALTIAPPDGATKPTRWAIRVGTRRVARGTAQPEDPERTIRLRVPACAADCAATTQWTLTTDDAGATPSAFPAFGAPGELRPVTLRLRAARMEPAP